MAIDPFEGVEGAGEAPVIEEKKETATVTADNKEKATVAEAQDKIVITLKGGAGYDAPWVVIHADDIAAAKQTLADEELKEVIDLAKKAGTYFAGGNPSAPKGKPAGATQAPGNTPTPPEGYVYKSGMGKNGRPWYAFMGANRADNLDPIWLNADGTRRN